MLRRRRVCLLLLRTDSINLAFKMVVTYDRKLPISETSRKTVLVALKLCRTVYYYFGVTGFYLALEWSLPKTGTFQCLKPPQGQFLVVLISYPPSLERELEEECRLTPK